MAAGLIASMRFTHGPTTEFGQTLSELTGEPDARTWFNWMQWQESYPEVVPDPWCVEFKRELFLAFDPDFEVFLRRDYIQRDAMHIRLEEIT